MTLQSPDRAVKKLGHRTLQKSRYSHTRNGAVRRRQVGVAVKTGGSPANPLKDRVSIPFPNHRAATSLLYPQRKNSGLLLAKDPGRIQTQGAGAVVGHWGEGDLKFALSLENPATLPLLGFQSAGRVGDVKSFLETLPRPRQRSIARTTRGKGASGSTSMSMTPVSKPCPGPSHTEK